MPSTAAAIRDRITTVISAIVPTFDERTQFRPSQNVARADFTAWAEQNAAGCLRRFQVRDDGTEEPPEVSNTDIDLRHVTYVIRIAYPQTQRYGKDAALDRDDVIDQDWGALERAVGIYSRSQYTGSYDATPLGATRETEIGDAVDFLVVRARFSYYRQVIGELDVDVPGTQQVFRYTVASVASTYTITLPATRASANYRIDWSLADAENTVGGQCPVASRTTSQFVLNTDAPLAIGDVLEFTVEDLT